MWVYGVFAQDSIPHDACVLKKLIVGKPTRVRNRRKSLIVQILMR